MKVVTFGEIMLRLAPPAFQRFTQAQAFEASYGGGEANVAVSLANYGEAVEFVTRLPKNELGEPAWRACAARRGHHPHPPRRRADRDLLPRDRGGPARQQGDLRPGRVELRDHPAGQDRLEDCLRGRGLVPLDRHHPGRVTPAQQKSAARRSGLPAKWA